MTDREIYEKHADELIRFATALVGPGDAPDMLSTAVVNALGSRQWPVVTNRRAYLYRSVLNATRSWQRSSGRRRTREYAVAETTVLPPPELHVDVRDAVADLSPQQRAVVHSSPTGPIRPTPRSPTCSAFPKGRSRPTCTAPRRS